MQNLLTNLQKQNEISLLLDPLWAEKKYIEQSNEQKKDKY